MAFTFFIRLTLKLFVLRIGNVQRKCVNLLNVFEILKIEILKIQADRRSSLSSLATVY